MQRLAVFIVVSLAATAVVSAASRGPLRSPRGGNSWTANSESGVDAPACLVAPQTTSCKSVGYTMQAVAPNDALFLDGGASNTGFAVPHNVFISKSNVSVIGVGSGPNNGAAPVLICSSTTALYITALGSTLQNFAITNCSMTAVIYDFESYSLGHVISQVSFTNNYKAVGAEDCQLTIEQSEFFGGTAGAVVMGGGALTVIDTLFDGNAQSPLGPLASAVMCAKCRSVLIGSCTFQLNAPVASSRSQQLPVVWIGYASGPVELAYITFSDNTGTAVTVVGCGDAAPVTAANVVLQYPRMPRVATGFDVRQCSSFTLHDATFQMDLLTQGSAPLGVGLSATVYLDAVKQATFTNTSHFIDLNGVVSATPLVDALVAVAAAGANTAVATTLSWTTGLLNATAPNNSPVTMATAALAFVDAQPNTDADLKAAAMYGGDDDDDTFVGAFDSVHRAVAGASNPTASLQDLDVMNGQSFSGQTGLPYLVNCASTSPRTAANVVSTGGITPPLATPGDVQCCSTCMLTYSTNGGGEQLCAGTAKPCATAHA